MGQLMTDNPSLMDPDERRVHFAAQKGVLSKWYLDHDEVVAFARWYWQGSCYGCWKSDILDFFEKPWKWTPEYMGYKEEQREHRS
jgi:hypothetical protein